MVFDGHSDLLYDVTRRRLVGEKRVLERSHLGHLEAGGVEGLVLALWVSAGKDTFWKDIPEAKSDRDRTEIMLLCMKAELAECSWLTMVRTPSEAETAKAAGKKYAELARAAGMGGSADTIALRNLKNGLIRLRRELNLPETLAQAGVDPRAVWRSAGDIVKATLADPCCQTNPMAVEDFLVRRILEEVTGRV